MLAANLRNKLTRPWFAFLCAGLVAIAAYFAIPDWQDGLYAGVGLASSVAIVIGWKRYRASQRAWLAIALGLALYSFGDIAYSIIAALTASEPFPSAADGFYLAGEVLIVIGVGRLAGTIGRGLYRPALLDAALVATAGAFIAWPLVLDPISAQVTDPLSGLIALSYPIVDLVLVGVLTRHFLYPGKKTLASLLLAAGVGVWLVVDLVYAVMSLTDGYASGDPIDLGWLLAYTLVGAAGLHPSMAALVRTSETHEVTVSNGRLVLIGASVTIPVFVFLLHGPMVHAGDYLAFGLGSVIIGVLGSVRLLGSLHSSRVLLAAQDSLQGELDRRARTDHLTGLSNRQSIVERLASDLASGAPTALMFLDLDDFKRVNDAFGHPAGDAFLREVAERIRSVIRNPDDVARLGGDEFAVVVSRCVDEEAAVAVARRIYDAFAADVRLDGHHFRIQASIGIVWCGGSDLTADEVLSRADIAMYRAKERGDGSYALFEQAMHDSALDRAQLRSDLEGAVGRGEITPWFQPIFDVTTRRLVAVEALARWNHPARGLVAPDDFVPIAELSGSIAEIDRLVLRVAAGHVADWIDMIGAPLQLHVNITPREAADPATVDAIAAALDEAKLPANCLVVEVVETALIDETAVAPVLAELKALGVLLSIDDFGSRYAVLTQLGRLPIDIVKLDRSLVAGVETAEGFRLLEGILRLAQSLRLDTVAEGVESTAVMPILRRLGCTAAQGYSLGRPMPAADFERRLVKWSRETLSA
ncbi:MAG TPA: EAL domain-containing protein [Candidatus Limnocylindrales bacterium]|nr:EAL domain-containing protein [Candidatus Limnocylindrales bacterium]